METKLLSHVCCFYLFIILVKPLVLEVCDCNKPNTRGLIDLLDPHYCRQMPSGYPKLSKKVIQYRVVTKSKPLVTWEGHTCSQWMQTKKITESFWVRSFDTVFSHTTTEVEPRDCWGIFNGLKCGGNQVVKTSEKTYSFTQEPVREGKWYATNIRF